jgi:hypothetical protein
MPIKQGDNGQYALSDIMATNAAASLDVGATMLTRINTDYETEFNKGQLKFGTSINIKIPSLLKSRKDLKWEPVNIKESEIPLAIDQISRIPLETSLPDSTFKLNSEEAKSAGKIGKSAGETIVADVDADILAKMVIGSNNGIVAPEHSFSNEMIDLAAVALSDNAVPSSALLADKTAVFNYNMAHQMRKTSRGLYNPQEAVAKMFLAGDLPDQISGFAPVVDRRVGSLKFGSGNFDGFAIANGGVRATVVSTTGFRVGDRIILKAGDKDVTVVDPQTKMPLSTVAMRAIVAIEGGTILVLSQPVIASGVNQNVSDLPTAAAYIPDIKKGELYDVALVFYRKAFTLASPELLLSSNEKTGVSISREKLDGVNILVTQQFVNTAASDTLAFQAIWGSTYVRPEWATVIFIPRK